LEIQLINLIIKIIQMKKYIFLLFSVFLFSQCAKKVSAPTTSAPAKNTEVFRAKAPGAAAARAINLGDYTTFNLDNGLQVIVVENHKLPRVSYQISLKNEPVLEGDQAGYISLAGSLMERGTTTRTKAQIDEAVDFIGGDLSASGSGMFATSLKKHSPKLMELMTDILYNPSFPKDEFEKLKTQTISGLSTQKTDANAMSRNIINSVLYGKDHVYGEIQTEKTTKAIDIEACKQYIGKYFRPNNAYLVIVGDITPTEARDQTAKYFAQWKGGDVPKNSHPEVAAPSKPSVIFANKDGAVQSVINVAYPLILKPGSADELAANVMNSILGGGGFSGRLMQNLREKKAYTYGSRSTLSSDRLVGRFAANASVRNAVTDSSVQEILYEMNRIVNEPVSDSDLALAKSSFAGSFARSLESPQTIAGFALNTFRYNLPKDYYNTYLSRLEKLSIADISTAAKKYIKPENAYIVVVGNKEAVAKNLLRFDGDNKIDYFDAFGEKLNDGLQIPSGVTAKTVIEDYIQAAGGQAKLASVKTLLTNASMSLMGQTATVTTKNKLPHQYATKIEMQGMVLMDEKTDGEVASQTQMGQAPKTGKSGDEVFESMKERVAIFEQLNYAQPGYKVNLVAAEEIEGVKCLKLSVTKPSGKSVTQFYDMKTNLLKKEVQIVDEKSPPLVIDYSDYKAVDGIMMPHTLTTSGMMPMPISMTISAYKLNTDIPDVDFK
jgi:zinc protease